MIYLMNLLLSDADELLKDFKSLQVKNKGGVEPKYDDHEQDKEGSEGKVSYKPPKDLKFKTDHPQEQIISDVYEGVKNRGSRHNICAHFAFVSKIEPNTIDQALNDEN